ncbi:MAG: helix-turn-helix transcriptional regulator [Clostridia bacterium]|nr:helix-turn-helix transcriptional regulator [Clostridia bacterium]
MNQEKIGKFIAELRKEKNLTQEQLAEKLGISNKSISRWENGKTMPDYSLLTDICNEFGITINELMSGEKIEKENYISKAEENLVLLKKRLDKMHKILNKLTSILSKTIFILVIVRISLRYLSIEILNTNFLKNLSYILFFFCTIGLVMSFILEVLVYEDDEK